MTAEDALEKIKKVVLNDCGGRRDDAMLTQVRHLFALMPACLTTYSSGKQDAILWWAQIYCSPRRHAKYGGPHSVATSIIGSCDVLIRNLPRERATVKLALGLDGTEPPLAGASKFTDDRFNLQLCSGVRVR